MDRKAEYAIRRRAAEDLHAEMETRGKEREARKARLLVDSLDMFYTDVAGGHGASPVDLTNPYVKQDYDEARAEIMAYLKGGEMPWIRRTPTKKQQAEAKKLTALKLSLGTPVQKKPLAVEMRIDLTQKHDRRDTRKQLATWRDWGQITAFVYTGKGIVFRFEGRMTLTQGRYMLKSEEGKHLPIQDMMLEPEQFEPPVVELGLNFERRSDGKAWSGHIR
jgi:hypothetical protein